MGLQRKAIIIIQDGVGDRPLAALGGKTPLQAAVTPNFDYIAKNGICGLVDPISPGVRAGTDVGHMALFGLDPFLHYTGRGPIEASGLGIEVAGGDVAFRINFATVNDDFIVVDRRAGRIREGTDELAAALDGLEIEDEEEPGNPVRIVFHPATEHRGVFLLRGEGLSDKITDSDPLAGNEMEKVREVKPTANDRASKRTARLVNRFIIQAHEILKNHPVNKERTRAGLLPANMVLTRGAGMVPHIEKTPCVHGIRGACVAAESTIIGVARMAGYKTYCKTEMTANLETNVKVKADLTLKALAEHNMVFVHIKGADLCGHDNRPLDKVKIIEKADMMAGEIIKSVSSEVYVALGSDHSTPCEVRDHSADPVPVAIFGPSLRVDETETFDEISCASGGLHRITGKEFFLTLADLIGATKKYGS